MQTSIATVCLSGTLVDKLHAIADAGFDAVEVFEPDLIAAPQTPEEVRALCDRLGLRIALYQPFRDAEGVTEPEFAQVLRRAEAKFELMDRLGVDTVLVCSNVATASIDDDAVSAAQLARLADLAAARGKRLAFEALAWGRFIDDYRRAWRIVERADHPALGVCLDSFHILSRATTPRTSSASPARRSSSSSSRTRPCSRWTCSPGAGTTGCSLARAASTSLRSSGTPCEPVTPGRSRWRSSTTCSARPTRRGPLGTPSGR